MNIDNELYDMTDRMFSHALLETILSAYQEEQRDCGGAELAAEYQTAMTALASELQPAQLAELAQWETLCAENVAFGLCFGFTQGVYVGFQQHFVKKSTKDPFQKFIVDQILMQPHMKQHWTYYNRKHRAQLIIRQLEDQLDKALHDHLTSMECHWDNQLYGVLRYAFYLGYRWSLSTIEEAAPLGSLGKMMGKILLTEYELGFTFPAKERELDAEIRAHREAFLRQSNEKNPE